MGDLGPKKYDPLKKPRLFTELDLASLNNQSLDEDGNELTQF